MKKLAREKLIPRLGRRVVAVNVNEKEAEFLKRAVDAWESENISGIEHGG